MLDIDGFKEINDQLGHQIGDRVLQQLGALITQAVRSSDLVIRYGGEEIALLLPSTGVEEAYTICERLRAAVERYDWAATHPDLRVTVSIGLTAAESETLGELLARADAQLYVAKRAGRSRTTCDRGCWNGLSLA